MILEKINETITKSMKEPDSLFTKNRSFLRLVKSDLQMQETRQNKPLSKEQEVNVLKKIVKNNQETINSLNGNDPRVTALKEEINILNLFLPETATKKQILEAVESITEEIKSAKSEGHAIGLCMKKIKEKDLTCEPETVKEVIKEIRT